MIFAESSISSKSSFDLGCDFKHNTFGYFAFCSITPISFKIPHLTQFSTVCVLNRSVGTSINTLLHCSATIVVIIVSVFPVPVGITTVAASLLTIQCARIANTAPNCACLKPFTFFELFSVT